MSQDEIGQTVSLRGRIVDRMHMEPRYASEKTGQNHSCHRGTWLGIPGETNATPSLSNNRLFCFAASGLFIEIRVHVDRRFKTTQKSLHHRVEWLDNLRRTRKADKTL